MQKLKKVLKAFVKTKLKKVEKKADKKPASKSSVKASPKKAAPKKLTAAPAKKPLVAKKVVAKPVVAKSVAAKKPAKIAAKKEVPLKAKAAVKTAAPEKLPVENIKKSKKALSPEAPVEKIAKKSAKKVVEDSPEEAPVEAKREYNDEEIILTDAEGRRYCRVKDCDQISSVDAYCRYHYLLFWKKIQVRKKILTEGKLERYVEELTARYPDKYLEMLRKDLRSEKDFTNAIQELELDDTSGENDLEDEAQSYIEEVRGMSSEGGTSRDDDEF